MKPAVVLVGVMGAGKTTIGTLVAEALNLPFRDTDDDIVAATGKPISDIFVDDGEDHFRALERQAVAAALDGFDGVLALGGGAVMAAETRERLRGHTVVFLDAGRVTECTDATQFFAAPRSPEGRAFLEGERL